MLPLHPLVVHAVVVLVPLAALGAVVIAVWPAARERFGWLVVVVAGLGACLTPVASASGEDLARRLPQNELVRRHESLGEVLVYFTVGLFVVTLALMLLHRRAVSKVVLVVASVVVIGVGAATGVHVFRVGEAGARAVWEGVGELPVR